MAVAFISACCERSCDIRESTKTISVLIKINEFHNLTEVNLTARTFIYSLV
jgi:hypothetical protein